MADLRHFDPTSPNSQASFMPLGDAALRLLILLGLSALPASRLLAFGEVKYRCCSKKPVGIEADTPE
jgi:hypothetical protein